MLRAVAICLLVMLCPLDGWRAEALPVATQKAAAQSPAQIPPGRFAFRSYGADEGLSSLAVMALAQDRDGFLWVATQEGLFRYDGERFRAFGIADGLPSAYLNRIAASPDGTIWCGTYAGVVQWDGKQFVAPPRRPEGIANGLAVDRDAVAWIASESGLYRGTTAGFSRVTTGETTAVWSDPVRGDLLVGESTRVRSLFNGVWTDVGSFPDRVDAVVRDQKGRVWVRSHDHLWRSLPESPLQFDDVTRFTPGASTNGYLSTDRRGRVWVPTDRGLAVHDEGWRVLGARDGLPVPWSRDVLEDREGAIWIGSLGVHRMLGRGEFINHDARTGLPNDVVWTFRRDREGELLVGTDLGLARTDRGRWSIVEGSEDHAIRTVIEDPDGSLWMGGSPAEVIHYDRSRPAGSRIRRYGPADGVTARVVMCIRRDSSGGLWAGTAGGGLLHKPAGAERFERVELPGGSPAERVSTVLVDRDGFIWAAAEQGLARFDGKEWRRYGTGDGLARQYVSYLFQASDGALWGAYFEPFGVLKFHLGPDGSLQIDNRYDVSNGLAASKIYLIGEDRRHRIWMGSGLGVNVLDSKGHIEHYDMADGLAGNDTDAMAFMAGENDEVFIGTSSGFSQARLSTAEPDIPPRAVILSASIGGTPIPEGSTVEVPHTKREVSIKFGGLSFLNERRMEFQHRLIGYDPEWRTSEGRSAVYTSLAPGEYTFELRSKIRSGRWGPVSVRSFRVLPAWWATVPSRIAAALAIAGLLALAFRWREAMLKRRTRELEILVEQRTSELAGANESLMTLTVTDALTGMKNRRYLQLVIEEATADSLRRHQSLSRSGLDPGRANADLLFFLLDLDHFKRVNDEYGHVAGDEVLVQLHAVLRGALRETDMLVRWGGEEFLVLARHTSRVEAAALAERMRAAVSAHLFTLPAGVAIHLTCSIGFAPFPFLDLDRTALGWEQIIDFADACLYEAKHAGRDRWIGIDAGVVRAPELLASRVRSSLRDLALSGEVRLMSSKSDATVHRPSN